MYDNVVDVPRLLAFYDEGDPLPDPLLDEAKQALDAYYRDELKEPFRTAGLCLYRDGRDSVAWHGDRIGRGSTEDTMVAIVSVGTPRSLLLRPQGGGATLRHDLGHGDLDRDGRKLPAHVGTRPSRNRPRRGGRESASNSGCAESADRRSAPAGDAASFAISSSAGPPRRSDIRRADSGDFAQLLNTTLRPHSS